MNEGRKPIPLNSETHTLTFWKSKIPKAMWEKLLREFHLPENTIKIVGDFTTLYYGTPKFESLILLDK
jgi:uncharacterized protein YjbK